MHDLTTFEHPTIDPASLPPHSEAIDLEKYLPDADSSVPALRPSEATAGRNVLLIGHAPQRRAVARALKGLDAKVRGVSWDAFAQDACGPDTVAAIIIGPPPNAPGWRSVATLRSLLPDRVAIAFVDPQPHNPRTIRRYYREGASVVFDWPRESILLAPVLAETLAIRMVHGKAKRGDRALGRVVRSHARLITPGIEGLSVSVQDGHVSLRGTAQSLPQAIAVESRAAEVPGVQSVDAANLLVEPSGLSDRAIRSSVKKVLSSVTEDTVAVAVSRGHVSLAGSVSRRAEARRLQDLIAHVRGVRGIDNKMVVSSKARAKDRSTAARVRMVLRAQFPQQRFELACFGGNVVVQGEVQTLATKRDVTRAIDEVEGVATVINKVRIRK